MINSRNKTIYNIIFSLVIFLVFFVYFFFYIVAPDNYVFFSFTEFNLDSIMDYFLHYGNGRILGNVVCAFFSHQFSLAPLFVSLSLLAIALLTNRLIFNSSPYTLLPISLLFIIADCRLYEGLYGILPTFVNYVFPLLPFLLSLYLFWLSYEKKQIVLKISLLTIAFVLAASSTLYSENTTIIFILFSILLNVYVYFTERKIKSCNVLLTVSLIIGALILLALPYVFGVEDKLAWYRGTVSFTPKSLLIQAAYTAMCAIKFTPLLPVTSAALILYMVFVSGKKINLAVCALLFGIPFIAICFYKNDDFFTRLILLAVLAFFALLAIYTALHYAKKEHKPIFCGLLFLILANIGMCIFVDPIGVRVLFVSYFFALILLLFVVKEAYPSVKKSINFSSRQLIFASTILLLFFVGFSFVSNVDSFNEQIYAAADKSIKAEINLEENGLYINKFICAIKYHHLVTPENGEKIFKNNDYLWEIIENLKK